MKVIFYCCVIIGHLLTPGNSKISRPTYFPKCTQSDPEINKCLLTATDTVKEYLVKGVPELQLLPIEPFKVPEINIEQGTQSLNLNAHLTDVLVHGLSHYKFTRFAVDLKTWLFHCDIVVPDIFIEGDYIMKGRLLIAPIEGKGRFTINVPLAKGNMTVQAKEVEKKGTKFAVPNQSSKVILEIKTPTFHFDGLFGNNTELGDATNKVINENADEVFANLKEILETVIGGIFADTMKKAVGYLPIDVVFPAK